MTSQMKLYVLPGGRIRATGAPVLAYLVRTPGANVLIDSGYPRDRAGAYRDDPDERIELDAGEDVPSRLGELGLRPGDIELLVCTHFDPDHAGNHDVFTGAELVVQKRHYDWAISSGSPRLAATRARWDRPGVRYRFVEGDGTLLPGVELIESSGHVPGHQSVLVRLPETGPVLLAADAIPTADAMDPSSRPVYPFDLNETEVRASTEKLMKSARAEKALIICGHDATALSMLRLSPGFYR
jgi:N-acyl homoserine lactone hydrolase